MICGSNVPDGAVLLYIVGQRSHQNTGTAVDQHKIARVRVIVAHPTACCMKPPQQGPTNKPAAVAQENKAKACASGPERLNSSGWLPFSTSVINVISAMAGADIQAVDKLKKASNVQSSAICVGPSPSTIRSSTRNGPAHTNPAKMKGRLPYLSASAPTTGASKAGNTTGTNIRPAPTGPQPKASCVKIGRTGSKAVITTISAKFAKSSTRSRRERRSDNMRGSFREREHTVGSGPRTSVSASAAGLSREGFHVANFGAGRSNDRGSTVGSVGDIPVHTVVCSSTLSAVQSFYDHQAKAQIDGDDTECNQEYGNEPFVLQHDASHQGRHE